MNVLLVLVTLLPVISSVNAVVTSAEYYRIKTLVSNAIRMSGSGSPLMGGCVRLGFHDCIGGCDGCVDLDNPNNAGLEPYINTLDSIDRGNMSRADLWALCVVESVILGAVFTPAAPGKVPAMPDITFRAGRPETPAVCPERTFPDETKNPIHFLLENFPGLMNSTELAYALMGGHTFGRAHVQHSGHFNAWTKFPNWADNEYFRVLLETDEPFGWYQVQITRAKDGEFIYQWIADHGQPLTMLHVDAHLVKKLEFYPGTTKAKCKFPGVMDPDTAVICEERPEASIARDYADDNHKWMKDFSTAIQAMIDNGNEDVLYNVA